MTPSDQTQLESQLQRLHLGYVQSNYKTLARKAAEQQRSHLDYLAQLVEGEFTMREMRSIEPRIKNARFPVRKTLDDFQWSWPKKINRLQIQNLFLAASASSAITPISPRRNPSQPSWRRCARPSGLSTQSVRSVDLRRCWSFSDAAPT